MRISKSDLLEEDVLALDPADPDNYGDEEEDDDLPLWDEDEDEEFEDDDEDSDEEDEDEDWANTEDDF